MPFAKGKSGNTKGRTPGVLNKSTAAAKEAFQLAFDGMGGVKAFIAWGKENPNNFYPLYSKLIPIDVKTDAGVTLVITRRTLNSKDDLKDGA